MGISAFVGKFRVFAERISGFHGVGLWRAFVGRISGLRFRALMGILGFGG